jgi:ribosomal protein L37AE/L43A
MDGYYCKECERPVIVRKGEIIRACKHKGTVVAGMKAVATAHGSLEHKK